MIRYALHMDIAPSVQKLEVKDGLLFHGSCFSEHIAKRLKAAFFAMEAQPNGILFNPLSLAEVFKRFFEKQAYVESDLIQHNGFWHSKFHHGSFSEIHASDTLKKANHELHAFGQSLSTAKWLFITFGSAYAYTYRETGETVANCHKLPHDAFEKRLLSVDEITSDWKPILQSLTEINPELHIVYTVSPVKHLRDGVVENNLSKATCLLAIRELLKHNVKSSYFPAYELVSDDLRDYRFYETDAAHPNALAINYVFDAFRKAYFSATSNQYFDEIEKYNALKNHRLLKADGEDYIKFMKQLEDQRQTLNMRYGLEL